MKVSYTVLDKRKKTIEINCGTNSCIFILKKKRAFAVLTKILEVYPRVLDIHGDLDEQFNDPNRAYNDLKNEEGYEPYLTEGKNKNSSMTLELDVEKLCQYCTSRDGEPLYLGVSDQRQSLSQADQKTVFGKCEGVCNVTKIPLAERNTMESDTFCKILKTVNYDHRRPLFRGGSKEISNFQILSELVNREKNKICKSCPDAKCDKCALAYPEYTTIIHPNQQDISELQHKKGSLLK